LRFPEGEEDDARYQRQRRPVVTSASLQVGQDLDLEVAHDRAVARGRATVIRAEPRHDGLHEVAARLSFGDLGPLEEGSA
jgi:hypothetical protein